MKYILVVLFACFTFHLSGQYIKKNGLYQKYDGLYVKSTSTRTPPVYIPVTDINLTSFGNYTSLDSSQTLQFYSEVIPSNAANNSIIWSVTNLTGTATTDQNGLLTGGNQGNVRMVLTSLDSSSFADSMTITVNEYIVPNSVNGEGRILWSQNFDEVSENSSVSKAEFETMMGEETVVNHIGEDFEIIDDGTGDHYLFMRMIEGDWNASSGLDAEKMFDTYRGGTDTALMNKKEMWFSCNVMVSSGFRPRYDGKFWAGGFFGGMMRGTYHRDDGKDAWLDGFTNRCTYDDHTGGAHLKQLMFWTDMIYSGGEKSGVMYPDWPTNSEPRINLPTTEWMNISCRIFLNDDAPGDIGYDGTNSIVEWYVNERLAYENNGYNLSLADTVHIDGLLIGFFTGGEEVDVGAGADWSGKIDDMYLFNFSPGDSTITGDTEMTSPYTIDVPGWPKGEDLTNWGKF